MVKVINIYVQGVRAPIQVACTPEQMAGVLEEYRNDHNCGFVEFDRVDADGQIDGTKVHLNPVFITGYNHKD